MDVRENGLGRVIGCELRCIPPRFLESCWGLKWCPKFYARGPSEFDIGVLTPDGKYNSLKIGGPLAMERGAQDRMVKLKPSPSLRSTIHDADGRLGLRRRELPSSPSGHFSVSASPVYIVHERTQDQPDFMHSHVTPIPSSAPLIAPGRTEGILPIPISGSGTMLSSIQPLSEPYTSELSYALIPGHSSQSCGAPNIGTPLRIMPAVSQDPGALLYGVVPENNTSLERLVSDPGDVQAYYLPPDSIDAHSTLQVHVITPAMQATLLDSWNNLDFSPASATPMTCSTSFSADSSLIGEFEQHHGAGVATPMSELMRMDLENSSHSNDQLEAGMPGEYWQLHRTLTGTRSSPMHQSRGLSPIDMSVDQLPCTGEGEDTTYNLSDTLLFSGAFHGAFAG
ncbi:hypothetical protein EV702DRAFT_1059689 [Suillus placidus]|uniref:Uncharacterized protein n=1 Tax=Suillus placidus TaxID=48579 RepID=A0A9P7A7C8_9AGAM|nr:hypothetical protein EV702DRAFT_1059689 [Suillus placidus]